MIWSPDGLVVTVHETGAKDILTGVELDHEERTVVQIEQRALDLTLKVPAAVHVLDWVTAPQAERSVPSPFQSN